MSSPYHKALQAIDDAHAQDPRKVNVHGQELPYELVYARKMTDYLTKRAPHASSVLRLAIRAQHLRRWEIPRDSYPMTKAGYYSWRTFLKKRQADLVEKLCLDAQMNEDDSKRVAALVRKEDLKNDEETQVLEDVACLVFLDDQFEGFKTGHDEGKLITILKKTWVKMSAKGHELALQIPMTDDSKSLIEKALSS